MKQTKLVQQQLSTTTITTTTTAISRIVNGTTTIAATPTSAAIVQNALLSHKTAIKSNEICLKLDKKSSRGMIYENEELRLRTININAEVERGQSDIKRLKKENELLRREIWTLRDECDRLSKKVKAKFNERPCCSSCDRRLYKNHKGYHCPCNGTMTYSKCECKNHEICGDDTCNAKQINCSSDELNVCNDKCCYAENENMQNDIGQAEQVKQNIVLDTAEFKIPTTAGTTSDSVRQEQYTMKTFDHLSIVSEEILNNPNEQLLNLTPDVSGSHTTLSSLVPPVRPLTPIELIANELSDLQAAGPPLSYFENILQEHMNSKIENSSDFYGNLKNCPDENQTKNWDYNLKSPFEYKYTTQIVPAVTAFTKETKTFANNFANNQQFIAIGGNNQNQNTLKISNYKKPESENLNCVRTKPTTTLTIYNSHDNNDDVMPKHFFAPLKPLSGRDSIVTKRNKNISCITDLPSLITRENEENQNIYKLGPPDIYVTNALASSGYSTKFLAQTSKIIQQPLLDSLAKSKVCRRLLKRKYYGNQLNREQHKCPAKCMQHAYSCHFRKPFNFDVNPLQSQHILDNTLSMYKQKTLTNTNASLITALISYNTLNLQLLPIHRQMNLSKTSSSTINPTNTTNKQNIVLKEYNNNYTITTMNCQKNFNDITKPHDPVYAVAQKSYDNLITSAAVTKPIMATTSNSFNILVNSSIVPPAHKIPSLLTSATAIGLASCYRLTLNAMQNVKFPHTLNICCKNDSINLDTLLSDIEAMSEDILSLQLETSNNTTKISDKNDKTPNQFIRSNGETNNKPYKSEMNLFLMYDDDITKIRTAKGHRLNPLTIPTTIVSMAESGSCTSTLRRARSLEDEQQQQTDYSPPPNVPDPMLLFPNNHTYIGFDGLKRDNHMKDQTESATTTTTTPKSISPTITQLNANDQVLGLLPFTTGQQETINSTSTTLQNSKFTTTISLQNVNSSSGGDSDNVVGMSAKIKRALFCSAPTQRLKLHDRQTDIYGNLIVMDEMDITSTGIDTDIGYVNVIKPKERRVSILCDDVKKPLPEYPLVTETVNSSTTVVLTAAEATTNSCCDLPIVLPDQTICHIRQISQSTPNSPHSKRKHNEPSLKQCNVATTPSVASIVGNNKQLAYATNVDESHLKQQQQQHQQCYPNVITQTTHKNNKEDAMRAAASDMICAAANVLHTKCTRRHSDGTLIHSANNQRILGSVNNGIALPHIHTSHSHSYTHSHSRSRMHHHSHYHQHNPNPQLHYYQSHHHSNGGGSSMIPFRQQSNQKQNNNHHETVTLSYAGHINSNGLNLSDKLSSSSSTSSSSSSVSGHSYSPHSQPRKLSISSHTGGKIPWCGCWGTGCL